MKSKPSCSSSELRALRKSTRTHLNQAKSHNIEESWQKFKATPAFYNKELCRARRRSFAQYCTDIKGKSEASRFTKILPITQPNVKYIKRSDKSWSTSSQESPEVLIDVQFPGSLSGTVDTEKPSESGISNLDYLLSSRNRKWAINSFKPFKPLVAEKLSISWLRQIFKVVFDTDFIPEMGLLGTVVFILRRKTRLQKGQTYRNIISSRTKKSRSITSFF